MYHVFTINYYDIYHLVRPADLASGARIEQIAIAEHARKNYRHAQGSRERHREHGARIPGMYETNPVLANISPHPHRGGESGWRLERSYGQMEQGNARASE